MRDQLLGFLNRKGIEFGLGRLEPSDLRACSDHSEFRRDAKELVKHAEDVVDGLFGEALPRQDFERLDLRRTDRVELLVFIKWAIQDLTFNRGSRLITGDAASGFNFDREMERESCAPGGPSKQPAVGGRA
jgi:hypothetical protein